MRLDPSEVSFAAATARRRAAYRRYAGRDDRWGRGLKGDPVSPILWGMLGEVAFARWVGDRLGFALSPDDGDHPLGDRGCDFVVAGYRVQVKTAATDYHELLVRTSEWADERCDLFVRAHWKPPRLRERSNGLFGPNTAEPRVVDLCGWAWHFDVSRLGSIVPARQGEHNNYALLPDRFRSMDDLAAVIAARLERGM